MTRMFHIQVGVGEKTTSFRFERRAIQIGRLADNDLVLPDASVADRAARLELPDFARGFTFQRPMAGIEYLDNGETVVVGRYALTFAIGLPPSARELEFLGHLTQQPSDDAMRAVYGDWLEEHGRIRESRFIRAQLELAEMEMEAFESEASRFARETLESLAKDFPLYWRRIVARPAIENCDLRFEVKCPKQWSSLMTTRDPNRRHCGACNRTVHFAPNVPAARRLALAGECVAVDIAQPRYANDLHRDPEERPMLMGVMAP